MKNLHICAKKKCILTAVVVIATGTVVFVVVVACLLTFVCFLFAYIV
jgi:hypothetical protein